jgi:integrase
MHPLAKSRSDGVQRYQPTRDQQSFGLREREILARYPADRTAPMDVLEILIRHFNKDHTAKQKEVSFKTRRERAVFLRRFFRELQTRGGFPTIPDPRNLGDRHVRAIVAIWQHDKLAAATIQTYLSFLRGLASWIGKPGLIRQPASYGLTQEQYQRHDASNVDKSWSGNSVDIDAVLMKVTQYDPHVGAMLGLIRAFGLRRKEAIMFRPFLRVVPFEATGLPTEKRKADRYISIIVGSKGGRPRCVPLDTPQRIAAIEQAQRIAAHKDGHMGEPGYSLKQAMRRFDYVMEKFGITGRLLGITAHGLRHEALIGEFEAITGIAAPVRGGERLPKAIGDPARKAVSELAGHSRTRASNAYCGQNPVMRSNAPSRPPEAQSADLEST